MASFTHGFSSALPYTGTGVSYPTSFFAHYPPEAGCIGLSAADALSINAKVTTFAREMVSRSIVDGTSFKITKFSVGIGGYDVSYPIFSTQVDPTAQELIAEVFRKEISLVETPLLSGIAKSFVCRLTKEDIKAGIGEIGLIAEIINSPYSAEIGTEFLFAAVHQPLNAKTLNHVVTYRVVIIL